MNRDKQKAERLRKEGKSYNEINKILNVPKSTLSYWLKKIKLEPAQAKILSKRSRKAGLDALLRRNKMQTLVAQKRAEEIAAEASKCIAKINRDELRLIGTSLYLGEGGKSKNRVDFTNSNPDIVKIIMKFFRLICNVDESKFRIQLALHDKSKEEEAKKHWANITGISQSQFIKVSFALSKYSKKIRKNRLPYGTVQIRICDVELFHRINGWAQGVIKKIDNVPG